MELTEIASNKNPRKYLCIRIMILCMKGKASLYSKATPDEENVKSKRKNAPNPPDEKNGNDANPNLLSVYPAVPFVPSSATEASAKVAWLLQPPTPDPSYFTH